MSKIKCTDLIWVGAHDLQEESRFVWESGEELPLGIEYGWRMGEPNSFGGEEDCVAAGWDRPDQVDWVDVGCELELPFICYFEDDRAGIFTGEDGGVETCEEVRACVYDFTPSCDQGKVLGIVLVWLSFVLLTIVMLIVLCAGCIGTCCRRGGNCQPPFAPDSEAEKGSAAEFTKIQIDTSALTGLRGLAALHVMVSHYTSFSLVQEDLAGGMAMGLFYILSGMVMYVGYAQTKLNHCGEPGTCCWFCDSSSCFWCDFCCCQKGARNDVLPAYTTPPDGLPGYPVVPNVTATHVTPVATEVNGTLIAGTVVNGTAVNGTVQSAHVGPIPENSLANATTPPKVKRFNGGEFLVKRLARLAPMYYVTNLLCLIEEPFDTFRAVFTVFGCTSWVGTAPFNGVCWSISTMAFFYFCFPCIGPRLQRTVNPGSETWMAMLLNAPFLLLAPLWISFAPELYMMVRMFPLVRIPVFIMGCLAAKAVVQRERTLKAESSSGENLQDTTMTRKPRFDTSDAIAFLYSALVVKCMVTREGTFAVRYYGEYFMPFLYYFWVIGLSGQEANGFFAQLMRTKFFQKLGDISMCVYMIHLMVLWAIGYICIEMEMCHGHPLWSLPGWALIIPFLLSVVLGYACLNLVEKPGQKLIIRLFLGKAAGTRRPAPEQRSKPAAVEMQSLTANAAVEAG